MNSDFEPPPFARSAAATVGGVLTAILTIASLQTCSNNLNNNNKTANTPQKPTAEDIARNLDKIDTKSMELPGRSVPLEKIAAKPTPYAAPEAGNLTLEEMAMARTAWRYFQKNWNQETGLVNSTDAFASVTMWDQAAAMAALVSAKEIGLVSSAEFQDKMSTMLKTLANLRLYKNELPNKVYNSKTLIPVNYGNSDQREEIGWSAIDLGRMAIWLKIVGARYPQFRSQTEAVWKHWKVNRLTRNGQMYGTSVVNKQEQYNQEGRLGYENYAAYGLKLWGLNVDRALNPTNYVAFVSLYNKGVPYDLRDAKASGANNYVLSEPYILDGIETGFQALPKAYADRILAAQEARYMKTKQLTAVTEDNLDREPYFVYSTLFVNNEPWAVITDTGKKYNNLRFVSAKAAVGWYVLYNTPYTEELFDFVGEKLKSEKGWYNGFYESLKEPNKALTANNNGVILECLLYKKVGKPFTVWAGVK